MTVFDRENESEEKVEGIYFINVFFIGSTTLMSGELSVKVQTRFVPKSPNVKFKEFYRLQFR